MQPPKYPTPESLVTCHSDTKTESNILIFSPVRSSEKMDTTKLYDLRDRTEFLPLPCLPRGERAVSSVTMRGDLHTT